MSQISLQNLKKSFGKTQVIHDLSIDVKDGELIVIVGPSGCGKSTLLRMVAGLEDANEGNILIDNKKKLRVKPVANFESLEFLRILNTRKTVVDWTETDLVGMENF